MRLFGKVKGILAILMLILAYFFAIPPVQSSPEENLSFAPQGLLSLTFFGLYLGCAIESVSIKSMMLVVAKLIVHIVFVWLVFERVKLGVI